MSYNAIKFVCFVWLLRGYHGATPEPIWLMFHQYIDFHNKTQCLRICSQLKPADSTSILFNTALLI